MPSNEDIDNNLDTSSQNLDAGNDANNPPADPAPADPIDNPQGAAAKAADSLTGSDAEEELKTDKPTSSSMKALLDQLSADPPAAPAPAPAASAGAQDDTTKPQDPPADPAAQTPPAAASTEPAPKTLEQEEAELLEGVKSPRGKERIKQVFAERKQLETDFNDIRNVIVGTNMNPQEFAQNLELGRLLKSNAEADTRVALEMIESMRAAAYQKLGIDAPGVDLLEGYDDLKQAVENMEITKERALELVKYRKQESLNRQAQEQAQAIAQDNVRHQQALEHGKQQTAAFLESKKHEVDYPVKEKMLKEYFQNPAQRDMFVKNFTPDQWGAAIQMLWNGFVVPPAAPAINTPQPIRSRPATLGTPSVAGATPLDKLASIVDRF